MWRLVIFLNDQRLVLKRDVASEPRGKRKISKELGDAIIGTSKFMSHHTDEFLKSF